MTEEYLEELIQKYAEGIATEEEIQILMNWYSNVPVAEVPWPSVTPGEKEEVYSRMLQRLQGEIAPKKGRVINFSWLRVAAVVLLVIGAGFMLLQFSKSWSASYVTVLNPLGKIQLVHLPDSSTVWLNAATELRYAKGFKNNRKIQLKGEAYFEVTKDAAHPFRIEAGDIRTTVLGTAFNIKAYEGETRATVSVASGSVKVSDNNKKFYVLKPSMHLEFNRELRTATTTIIDTNLVLSWKKGRLQFEGVPFSEIASSLERWYHIKIVFNKPVLLACRYYISFDHTTPLEKVLSALTELTAMNYSVDKKTNIVSVSGNGCQ